MDIIDRINNNESTHGSISLSEAIERVRPVTPNFELSYNNTYLNEASRLTSNYVDRVEFQTELRRTTDLNYSAIIQYRESTDRRIEQLESIINRLSNDNRYLRQSFEEFTRNIAIANSIREGQE